MTDRELMQMALDALNNFDKGNHGMRWQVPIIKALRSRLANEFNPDWNQVEALQESLREHMAEIQRLRAALAQPEPEPITMVISETGDPSVTMSWWHEPALPVGTPLYTAPPQREWVGLTNAEYEAMAEEHVTNCYFDTLTYAKGIEAKLREKNG